MSETMDLPTFVRTLRRRAQNLTPALRRAEQDVLYRAARRAEQLSGGPFSAAMLRKLGHPYARAHPNPPADPAIVNGNTGILRNSWRTTGPFPTGSGMVSRLYNDTPYARYILSESGTKRMIPRPLIRRLRGWVTNYRHDRLVEATSKALSSD